MNTLEFLNGISTILIDARTDNLLNAVNYKHWRDTLIRLKIHDNQVKAEIDEELEKEKGQDGVSVKNVKKSGGNY